MSTKMIKRDEQDAFGAPTPSMSLTPLSRHAEGPPPSAGEDAPVERRAGRLLAGVAEPPTLDRMALARVQARLFGAGSTARSRSRFAFARLALGSTLGGVALLGGGVVLAGIGVLWKTSDHQKTRAAAEVAAPAARPPRKLARVAPSTAGARVADTTIGVEPAGAEGPGVGPSPVGSAVVPPAVAPAPAPAPATDGGLAPSRAGAVPPWPARAIPTATSRKAAAPAVTPLHAPAAPLEPGAGGLARETRLLGQALRQLRQQRDGAAALALLDDYAARFPAGTLTAEARRARIDALLLLDRRDEALRALETASLEPIGRGQELLVIRGELRGRTDCAAAIADFNQVLGRSAPSSLDERALFGRAVCADRLHKTEAARADARAYLARYPAGRFAAAARRIGFGAGGAPSND
jgi:hypothetical protein